MTSIFPVASEDSADKELISSATTANPLPASPALAASMAAFNASKFVCWAMLLILSTMPPMEFDFWDKSATPVAATCVVSMFSANFFPISQLLQFLRHFFLLSFS